jgi:hypothetical protein
MPARRHTRTLTLIILLAIVFGLLSACGGAASTPAPAPASGGAAEPTTAPAVEPDKGTAPTEAAEPAAMPEPTEAPAMAEEPTAAPAAVMEKPGEPAPAPTEQKPGEPAPAEPEATEPIQEAISPEETATPALPEFPWPPPEPSTMAVVPLRLLADRDAQSTLSDIDVALSEALDATGYYEKAYFTVPDGFALVTRLEQIEADGRPKPLPDRWSVKLEPLKRFTLAAYLQALFGARAGHYRLIVFVVTDVPIAAKSAPVSEAKAQAWLNEGGDALPAPVASQALPEGAKVTALVYQFRQPGQNEQAVQLLRDALPARIHLEKALLWSLLAR